MPLNHLVSHSKIICHLSPLSKSTFSINLVILWSELYNLLPSHKSTLCTLCSGSYKLYTSLYHTKVKNAKIYAISPFLQGSLFIPRLDLTFLFPPSPPSPRKCPKYLFIHICYSKNRDKRFYEDFFSKEAQDSFVFFYPEHRE